MKTNNKILKFGLGIRALSRGFPYGRYLITVFPIFATLIHNGLITSPWSLLLIVPFISAIATGFIYNTICDANKDPKEKNIITRGDFVKTNAFTVLISSIIISLLIFLLIYASKISFIFFIVYIIFWLAYSGLNIRLKETYLAPIIASIVLWVGAPFILLTEFQYFDYSTTFLLLGLFVIYIGHEIKHTTIEHDMDLEYNCKTFAVRCGKKCAIIIEHISILIGYLLLLISAYYLLGTLISPFIIIFLILSLVSIVSTITYGIRANYNVNRDVTYVKLPYIIAKLFIIIYGCLVLELPLMLVFFIIWIFLINKYP